jgi:hypothetical protein
VEELTQRLNDVTKGRNTRYAHMVDLAVV